MASNLTVKKYDGTTDITYIAIAGAAGDKSPAVFRATSVGAAAGHHPELRIQSAYNGTRTARKVAIQYSFPALVTSADTGDTTVKNRVNGQMEFVLPVETPDATIQQAAAQFVHLLGHADVLACLVSGFAPV